MDIIKISLAVVAGVGGVVALVVAYRKQRVTEVGETREQAKLFNERFTTASGQLGNESPAVRLAGVHALAALADDWEDGRQMCIAVLCAYLRMPPDPEPDASTGPAEHAAWAGMDEVRGTIWRLIAAHLDAKARIPWHGADFDFTGVTISRFIDFATAVFPSGVVAFDRAKISSGGWVRFDHARFSGGTVLFQGTQFSDGFVTFEHATFSGGIVAFTGANFSGAGVAFRAAAFSGSKVTFGGAKFSAGQITFDGVADWSVPPVGLPPQAPGLSLPSKPAPNPAPEASPVPLTPQADDQREPL
ncbi:hypothetical protein ACIBF7_44865 [Nonomuraea sp. NPDC050478]|uniref:hypothetical protein n=1 Tax=Nonomuraea sp. NPDC050478 TaxID=3364365 RepID=UPI0037B7435D